MDILNVLLQGLQSEDNQTRTKAENQFRNLGETRLPQLIVAHIDLLLASTDLNCKRFTAVLLRRLISTKAVSTEGLQNVHAILSSALVSSKRDLLLRHIYSISDPHTAKQLVDVIVTMLFVLCRQSVRKGASITTIWPFFFQSLMKMGQQPTSDARRTIAADMWLQICVTINNRVIYDTQLLAVLYNYLQQRVSADPLVSVRLTAINTACAICLGIGLSGNTTTEARNHAVLSKFAEFFHKGTLPTLHLALGTRPQPTAMVQHCLSNLIELAENCAAVFVADESAVFFCGHILKLASIANPLNSTDSPSVSPTNDQIASPGSFSLTPGTRSLIVEFLVVLIERFKQLLVPAGSRSPIVRPTVMLVLKLICTGGITGDVTLDGPIKGPLNNVETINESEWGSNDDSKSGAFGEEDLTNLGALGAGALDRISTALGPSVVLPSVFEFVDSILSNPRTKQDWRLRWGVLVSGTAVCNANSTHFMQQLTKLIRCAIIFATDSHFMVQYAAVNLICHIGRLCRQSTPTGGAVAGEMPQHGEGIGKSPIDVLHVHGKEILSTLSNVIMGSTKHCLRVRARACRAVASFRITTASFDEHQTLITQIILKALLHNAHPNANEMMRAAALSAITSFARELGPRFKLYASYVGPVCVGFLKQCCNPNELRKLLCSDTFAGGIEGAGDVAASMLECIGMMADVLTQDQFIHAFGTNVVSLMFVFARVLHESHSGSIDTTDLLLSVLQTLVRIARSLQEHFRPFLQSLMTLLIGKAALNADPSPISAAESFAIASGNDCPSTNKRQYFNMPASTAECDVVNASSTLHGIDTALVEEKVQACNLIYQLASDLNDTLFLPFVQQTTALFLPLLHYQFSPTVRVAAYSIIPKLLQIQIQYLIQQTASNATVPDITVAAMLHRFQLPLGIAFGNEQDAEAREIAAEALADLFRGCCVASHLSSAQVHYEMFAIVLVNHMFNCK